MTMLNKFEIVLKDIAPGSILKIEPIIPFKSLVKSLKVIEELYYEIFSIFAGSVIGLRNGVFEHITNRSFPLIQLNYSPFYRLKAEILNWI